MFDDVLDTFLHHPKETGSVIEGHNSRNPGDLEPDRQARAPTNLLDMVFDSRAQSSMLQE